jgi:hypothetical protein
MWMNLADLIHNRVADRKGNILPVDVNTVTYDLQNSTPRSYGLMANVLSIDSTLDSRVRSGYANCCSTINPGWDPSAVILGFGTNVTYGLDATDSCNGDQDDLLPDSSDWASADPSIAKVTKGEVAAVTAGSTTGSADVFVVQGVGGYCAGQLLPVTAPITVQVPKYFGPTGYDPVSCLCDSGSVGACIEVQYQTLDQAGAAMQASGITPQELVCVSQFDPPCQEGYSQFATPPTTTSTGTFVDTPLGTCFENPKSNVCVNVTQQFQAAFGGQTDPISTLTTRLDCAYGEQNQVYGNPSGFNQTYSYGTLP